MKKDHHGERSLAVWSVNPYRDITAFASGKNIPGGAYLLDRDFHFGKPLDNLFAGQLKGNGINRRCSCNGRC